MNNEQLQHHPEFEKVLFAPIPLEILDVKGYDSIEIEENGEPLVPMGPYSGNDFDRFFTSSIYYGERHDSPYERGALENSLVATFAREGAARQLLDAEALLPQGHHLILLDTYRTFDVQKSLYEQYAGPLRLQHPDWTEDQIFEATRKFVSKPSTDPAAPSTHNTGGSIDLAIYRLPDNIDNRVAEINELIKNLDQTGSWEEIYKLEMERIGLIAQNAELLDFGTPFDWGGPEAELNYLEVVGTQRQLTPQEEAARNNRRLLYNVMIKAGYEPFIGEWWHFNSAKTQMGAKTSGLPFAEYGPKQLSPENQAYEQVRRRHIEGTEKLRVILDNSKFGNQLKNFSVLAVAKEGAERLGAEYKVTSLPKAAIIKPPEQKAA
jgi:zinc D-Ala-D-Ala dipeptidase